ncbi:MAG: hypothetical protein ABI184_05730, partial [Ginsengibacter sp.]
MINSLSFPKLLKRKLFINWIAIFAAFVFIGSCTQKEKLAYVDPAFSQYIDGYTSGTISKTASIKIKLSADASTTHPLGEIVDKKLFSFLPTVNGKAVWLDARTIEFQPAENLRPDQLYKVSFSLGKVTKVPEKYADFVFDVQTIKPSFQVTDFGLRSTGAKDMMFLPGIVETADIENDADVEKWLTASENGKNLKITWQHNGNVKTHNFTVEDIDRKNTEQSISLAWNSTAMNIKGDKTLEIPAVGSFKVLNVMPMNDAEQYASVQFSDPVLVGQDLTGLIVISDQKDITYSIDGSEVKLYTGDKLDGNYTININRGIKNTFGDTLEQGYTSNVFFENRMPSVKIQGRGNILPNTGKLILPFESTNLNAVDISIIKIYENNIPQFLQGNNLDGQDDLRRVAKPIVQKTLRLDDDKTLDLHQKQRFSLDIDKFLKTEPGAIYRVTIGFRPEYSLYNCQGKDT